MVTSVRGKTSGRLGPQWHRRPDARRDELLDAALGRFEANGVTATTVEEITDAAGVAKGTFYRYFASKADLLSALKDRFFAGMVTQAVDVIGARGGLDRAAVIETGLEVAISYLWDNAALLQVWTQADDPGAAYRQTARGLVGLAATLEGAITDGVAAGEFDCPDPAETAALIAFGVQGAVTAAILGPAQLTKAGLIGAAVRLTRRALGVDR